MKIVMKENYNGLKKGESHEVAEGVGNWLIQNSLASECNCTKDEDCEECKGKTKKTNSKTKK